MKYLINENQFKGISNQFKKTVESIKKKYDIRYYGEQSDITYYWEALSIYKLPINIVSKVIEPKNGHTFTPLEMEDILKYYINVKQLPTSYENNDGIIIEVNVEDDIIRCDLSIEETEEFCNGYVDLFNNKRNKISTGFDFYSRGNWMEPDESYVEDDRISIYDEFEFPIEIKNLDELFDWYREDYFQICLEKGMEFLKKARKKYPLTN